MPYGFAGLAVGRADVTRFTTLAGSTKTVTPPPTTGIGGIIDPGRPGPRAFWICPATPKSRRKTA